MSRFLSNFEKQIDAKGRVSVPASFRAAVSELGGDRIFCFPSLMDASIECYAPTPYFALLDRIEGVVESPEAREDLEVAMISRCMELTFDSEGRVSFPERLLKAANIEKGVTFVGRGDRFQLWEPSAYTALESRSSAGKYRHLVLLGGKSPAMPSVAALNKEGV